MQKPKLYSYQEWEIILEKERNIPNGFFLELERTCRLCRTYSNLPSEAGRQYLCDNCFKKQCKNQP